MRIGIITFHWATNYGAVIQAYALQEFFKTTGSEVDIINYKPSRYTWLTFKAILKNPLTFKQEMRLLHRERLINRFRKSFLQLTRRYRSGHDLKKSSLKYDLIISGSDQILNPTFTIGGEGKPTDVYFLGFVDKNIKKIGYAVSFGCNRYPENASKYASKWINNFDAIGVREKSGMKVLEQLQYNGCKEIVPDPTLLYGNKLFKDLNLSAKSMKSDICVYMLKGIVASIPEKKNIRVIDNFHRGIELEDWLVNIRDTNFLVTNSYHGMLMAILFHTQFVIIRNTVSSGQNDRINTVLKRLNLEGRIVDNERIQIAQTMKESIKWDNIDSICNEIRNEGVSFLARVLNIKRK